MTKNDILVPVKEFSFVSSLPTGEPLWVHFEPTNHIYKVSSLNVYHVLRAGSENVDEIVTANCFVPRGEDSYVTKEEIVVTSDMDTSEINLDRGNLLNEGNLLNAYIRLQEIENR